MLAELLCILCVLYIPYCVLQYIYSNADAIIDALTILFFVTLGIFVCCGCLWLWVELTPKQLHCATCPGGRWVPETGGIKLQFNERHTLLVQHVH